MKVDEPTHASSTILLYVTTRPATGDFGRSIIGENAIEFEVLIDDIGMKRIITMRCQPLPFHGRNHTLRTWTPIQYTGISFNPYDEGLSIVERVRTLP